MTAPATENAAPPLRRRIQRRRVRGWRKPPGAICVTRPGRWGNPFDHRLYGAPLAVQLFREWLDDPARFPDQPAPPSTDAIRAALTGHDLACWCRPGAPCHANVLLAIANGWPW